MKLFLNGAWRSIDPLTKVKVRVPHVRHGLAGKT